MGANSDDEIGEKLEQWYTQTSLLHYHANYSLIDIYNMLPYEVNTYSALYLKHRKDQEKLEK